MEKCDGEEGGDGVAAGKAGDKRGWLEARDEPDNVRLIGRGSVQLNGDFLEEILALEAVRDEGLEHVVLLGGVGEEALIHEVAGVTV